MFLNDETPRINPTLFMYELDEYSLLFVAGGFILLEEKTSK